MFFLPHTRTHTRTHTWILLLADRYHVSYAFCHGEIHSTIFHLSPPLPSPWIWKRADAGQRRLTERATSRVGGNKKRRHVARWILLGKGMMESGGKSGSSWKCKRGETKIFSVLKKQKREQGRTWSGERGRDRVRLWKESFERGGDAWLSREKRKKEKEGRKRERKSDGKENFLPTLEKNGSKDN